MKRHFAFRKLGSSLPPLLLLGVVCWSCGPGTVDPPRPPLDGVEPQVAQRLEEATADVREQPASGPLWGRLGTIYDVHGFAEQAVLCYRQAERLDSAEWRWPYFEGLVLRASDRAGALRAFSRAAELRPDYPPLQVHLGTARLNGEEVDRAASHFRRALELDPRSVNALLGLARVALVTGHPDEALQQARRAAALAPDDAAVHRQLAEIHRALDQTELAELEQRRAELSPVTAREGGMAAQHDPVREEATLREGVSMQRLLENSQRYLARGRNAEALEALDRAVAADPTSIPALLASARAFAKVGDLTRAAAFVDRALELEPDSAEAYLERGSVLTRGGDLEGAIAALEHALELDPDLAEARSNLAAVMFEAGRTEEGLALLRDAARQLPGRIDVQYNLGAMLLNSGRPKEAAEVLSAALELHPRHGPSRYLLGVAEATRHRFEAAAAAFREALSIQPDHVQARVDLGLALWELGRYKEAVALFHDAVQRAPTDAEVARELAWALAVCPRDELRDGATAMKLAVALCQETDFGDPRMLDVLAAAQAETGDFGAATDTIARAIRIVRRTMASGSVTDSAQLRLMSESLVELQRRQKLYRAGQPFHESS